MMSGRDEKKLSSFIKKLFEFVHGCQYPVESMMETVSQTPATAF